MPDPKPRVVYPQDHLTQPPYHDHHPERHDDRTDLGFDNEDSVDEADEGGGQQADDDGWGGSDDLIEKQRIHHCGAWQHNRADG